MIIVFNHLFLYGIIGVERGEFLVNELRKIMGLDEAYAEFKKYFVVNLEKDYDFNGKKYYLAFGVGFLSENY